MIPKYIKQISCERIGLGEENSDLRVSIFVSDQLISLMPDKPQIITFDGFDGAGKSTLARSLGATLNLPVISLDDFLEKEQGHFLEAIKFKALSRTISEELEKRRGVVIEGCQVQSVLDRTGYQPDFRIYVMQTGQMRWNPEHEWVQEHEILYGEKSTSLLIADSEEMAKNGAMLLEEFGESDSGELPQLTRELIVYHREVRPHDHADVIIKIYYTI